MSEELCLSLESLMRFFTLERIACETRLMQNSFHIPTFIYQNQTGRGDFTDRIPSNHSRQNIVFRGKTTPEYRPVFQLLLLLSGVKSLCKYL